MQHALCVLESFEQISPRPASFDSFQIFPGEAPNMIRLFFGSTRWLQGRRHFPEVLACFARLSSLVNGYSHACTRSHARSHRAQVLNCQISFMFVVLFCCRSVCASWEDMCSRV
jgi:hypothetical protein